jgi:GABA(A) receptor-associated protein
MSAGSMQQEVSFEKRAAEARRILNKYPDRIPVIVEKAVRSTLPDIDKKKFLVPGTMLCGEFKYIIHKHLQQQTQAATQSAISAEQTVYLFIKNTPPRTGALMSELYESSRDEDGFLYMEYSAENTLGL